MTKFRLVALVVLMWAGVAQAAHVLPPEFVDESRGTGLAQPVNFDYLPDGRVLIVERVTGRIRLVRGVGAVADTVGTVPDLRTSGADEGLLGIAVDPNWPTKPYVYVLLSAASTFNLKLVRFALTGDLAGSGDGRLALDLASRRDLLADLPDDNSDHNGGTVMFGPDRRLYVALGDDSVPCSAQDKHQLRGKILRLALEFLPDGGGPALNAKQLDPLDNPFFEDTDPRARLVWQWGLRNPYSFDFDPLGLSIAIADVGEHRWEEVDVTQLAGRNFGWPFLEGNAPFNFECENTEFSTLTAPAFLYAHDTTLVASNIMLGGICWHPPLLTSGFPQEYWGQVFYFDYFAGRVKRLAGNPDGLYSLAPPVPGQPDADTWGTGFTGCTRMRFGPDGMLWYVQGTELRRISHPGVIGVPDRLPGALALAASPVPTMGSVRMSWRVPRDGRMSLFVTDARGRRVRTLVPDGVTPAGDHAAAWDGTDDRGVRAPAGVYFAAVRFEGKIETRRLVLLSR